MGSMDIPPAPWSLGTKARDPFVIIASADLISRGSLEITVWHIIWLNERAAWPALTGNMSSTWVRRNSTWDDTSRIWGGARTPATVFKVCKGHGGGRWSRRADADELVAPGASIIGVTWSCWTANLYLVLPNPSANYQAVVIWFIHFEQFWKFWYLDRLKLHKTRVFIHVYLLLYSLYIPTSILSSPLNSKKKEEKYFY